MPRHLRPLPLMLLLTVCAACSSAPAKPSDTLAVEVVRRDCLSTVPHPPGPPPELAPRSCGAGDVCMAAKAVLELSGWIEQVSTYVQQVEISCSTPAAAAPSDGGVTVAPQGARPCTPDGSPDCLRP